MSWPSEINKQRNRRLRTRSPASYHQRNIIHLYKPLRNYLLSHHPGLPPPGRWERSLSHPFAEIEISRALQAEKDARINCWQLLLPALTLTIPLALCLYGLVNYFIH
ncbi:hypothetical protein [Desulfofundulus sp.]|uniref:hypothetical protein n=1 Tax=Desulfofundulus sp. TaxID=2282750 RepID=UPI003C759944